MLRRDIIIYCATACILWAFIRPALSDTHSKEISEEHYKIHQRLTQGVKTISAGSLCPVIPLRSGMYPIVCGDAESYTGNPLYLQGSCPPVVLAGRFGEGRIAAVGHDGWLLERSKDRDTSRLCLNCLEWLAGSTRPGRIGFYTSIGSLVTTKTFSTEMMKELSEQGISVADISAMINPTALEDCSVLVIARPHNRLMNEDEVETICKFVENGGGLFMAGLCWYWAQNNPTLTIEDFPLNRLGSKLGVKFVNDTVWEQDEKGVRVPAKFQVGKLSAWHPRQTKLFELGEITDQGIQESVRIYQGTHNFAIEGEHVMLNLPADAFLQLRSPTKVVEELDAIYETHARLASNVPYNGRKISFVVVDRLKYHLCSGNPVLIRRDRVPVVLNDFNKLGHPGWGLIHELGHDFVASAHKHIYQLGSGDNESWANVFTFHAYDTLKLDYDKNDAHFNEFRTGIDYYFAKKADYEQLKNDSWIMLGLLRIIKEAYGWDAFYRFFEVCAQKAEAGQVPGTEQEKIDFLVRELSLAAGVDLSSYFVRWGFPVSKDVVNELRTLPPAELDEAARKMAMQYKMSTD